MGVLDGAADLRAGQVRHDQLAGVAVQLDSPATDLQPEGVRDPGRRLTPGPVLAPPTAVAGPLPLARATATLARSPTPLAPGTAAASTLFATGTATPLSRTALASRALTLARRAAPAIAPPLASTGPTPPLPGRSSSPLAA